MDRASEQKRRRGKTRVRLAAWFGIAESLEHRTLLSDTGTLTMFGATPGLFVQNQGQWADSAIRYALKAGTANVLITDNGPIFQALGTDSSGHGIEQFSVGFDDSNSVHPTGIDRSSITFGYHVGGDPSRWREAVSGYQKIAYHGLYAGVDLYTWAQGAGLKYEFHVAPGADSSQIVVSYSGIKGLSIDGEGRLHVTTAAGELVDDAPFVYQTINGHRVQVRAAFELVDNDTYTFSLGQYHHSQELVIDPDLSWSTYLGGAQSDAGNAIFVDAAGNSYVAGQTQSADVRLVPPVIPNVDGPGGHDLGINFGGTDILVAKYNNTGAPFWINYYGGDQDDTPHGITVDSNNVVYVAGETQSAETTFPLINGFNQFKANQQDGFIMAVRGGSTNHGEFIWGSFIGGDSSDIVRGIAVDSEDSVYLVGQTSTNAANDAVGFPLISAIDNTFQGASEAFAMKIAQQTIIWSTYFGGAAQDNGTAIAINAAGVVAIAGNTQSNNLPFTGIGTLAYQPQIAGGQDAFVLAIQGTGALSPEFLWTTYLGGENADNCGGVAIDDSGNVAVTGQVSGQDALILDFPLLHNFETAPTGTTAPSRIFGANDAYVAEFDSTGILSFSTFWGGGGNDQGNALDYDSDGNLVVVGSVANAAGTTVPMRVVSPIVPFGGAQNGGGDGFILRLTPADRNGNGGPNPDISMFFGGAGADNILALAVHPSGGLLFTGTTASNPDTFPGMNPLLGFRPFQPTNAGGQDAFVSRIAPDPGAELPEPPTSVQTTVISFSEIDLRWVLNSNNQISVIVRRSTTGQFGPGRSIDVAVLGPSERTYKDLDLLPSTKYFYQIVAKNDAGEAASVTVSATTSTAEMSAPAGLVATVISSIRIDLSWIDTSNNEQNVEVWRQTVGVGSFVRIKVLPANATSFRDDATLSALNQLLPGTQYAYRIRNSNAFAVSPFSDTVLATTKASTFVAAPSGLFVNTRSDGTNLLTWVDNSTNEDGFTVERRIAGSSTTPFGVIGSTGAGVTVFLDSTASASQIYQYRVRAFFGSSTSAYSNTATSNLTQALATPTRLEAVALSSSQIKLTWLDNSVVETGFSVERSIGAAGDWAVIGTAPANATSFYDKRANPNIRYFYRIRAVAGTDVSPYSNTANDRALPQFVASPRSPSDLQGTLADVTSARLKWRDNASDETAYQIERADTVNGSFKIIATVRDDVTSYTDNAILGSKTYEYRVRALNGQIRSTPSNIVRISTGVPPKLSVQAAVATTSESGTGLTFTFRRKNANLASDLVVPYTLSGTASNGVDYTSLSGTITIRAGSATAVLTVKPVNDTVHEPGESVSIMIMPSTKYARDSRSYSTSGMITDND